MQVEPLVESGRTRSSPIWRILGDLDGQTDPEEHDDAITQEGEALP